MPDAETPTETEVPTPAEVAEAPKTEAAPEQVTTLAEEPTPAAEPTEAKPEAEVPDPYDELEHERFKPVLERRDRRNDERVRADYQRQYEEATGKWASTEAHNQLAGIHGNILQKMDEGDAEFAGKLIGRLEETMKPFTKDYREGIEAEGSQKTAQQFYGAVLGSLDHRGQDELQDYLTVNRGADWPAILNKRDEIREGKATQSSSTEITALKAQIEDLKAKARPEGPDTTTKTAIGGDDNKRLLDPTTPIAEIKEIRARQKAAGE